MTNRPVYLKQNVQVDPLFNQWYAWTYLVSPATAAMYIANLHIKIMQSFIASPEAHVAALKNPAMLGGPFVNYGPNRVGDVKALLARTVEEQTLMLSLAGAIKALDETLDREADGSSLEALYPKIPDLLKGYVELVYDLNNRPSIRFIEGLFYQSPFYNSASQSIALSLIEKDERSFVLSTPRLDDAGGVRLDLPFAHEGANELFKTKRKPRPLGELKEILSVKDEADDLFASFFTEEEPPAAPEYTEDSVRIRYFGHACLLIEADGCSLLTDPVISYKYDNGIRRYTFADLPEQIDYVLLTHNHQDHVMFETLLQLRHKIRNVVVPKNNNIGLADPSLKLILRNLGFRNIIELDEVETLEIEQGSIMGLPFFGEHADVNIRSKMAYLIRLKGRSMMCVADSNNIEPKLYDHLHDLIGDVDLLFIGMECAGAPMSWLYGPLLTRPLARRHDQSRRFDGSDCEKGMGIVNRFNFKQVYVYAMGMEPWLTHITSIVYTKDAHQIVESDRLVEECLRRGLVSERLYGQKEIHLSPIRS